MNLEGYSILYLLFVIILFLGVEDIEIKFWYKISRLY